MSGNLLARAAGPVVFGVVAVALALRLPFGLGLSDEAYYAGFVKYWIDYGIAGAPFLTVHQTAALLVYPLARLYARLNGGTDGMYLFLRVIFLCGNVVAALCWQRLARRLAAAPLAWASALLVLVYVPFGIPAPSYNTLAVQGLVVALAGLGSAMLEPESGHRRRWLAVSAVAWGVVVVAYPSLIAVGGLCALGALAFGDRLLPEARRCGFGIIAAVAVLGGLTVLVLSPRTLLDSIAYTQAINDVAGFGSKAGEAFGVFAGNPAFAGLCAVAAVLGLARDVLPLRWRALITAIILLALFASPPGLYVRAHDAVLLLALTGLGLLRHLGSADPRRRAPATIYGLSLLAGLVTSITATHGILNFGIGGFAAAVVALSTRTPEERAAWGAPLGSAVAAIAVVASTSFLFFYGEVAGVLKPPFRTIDHGFYAGIVTTAENTEMVEQATAALTPALAGDPSLAVTGRFLGLALAVPARIAMPTLFPLTSDVAVAATAAYYADPARRPHVVAIYDDRYFTPLNPFGAQFDAWYRLERTMPLGEGTLSIYLRR